MCKKVWVSDKNGTGGLVQLRKGYRSEVSEYSGSQMSNKNQTASKEEFLDKTAIKEKKKELEEIIQKEKFEYQKETGEDWKYGSSSMYSSECPQCKGKSNQEMLGLGYPREIRFYVERLVSHPKTMVESEGIKSVKEKISKRKNKSQKKQKN